MCNVKGGKCVDDLVFVWMNVSGIMLSLQEFIIINISVDEFYKQKLCVCLSYSKGIKVLHFQN